MRKAISGARQGLTAACGEGRLMFVFRQRQIKSVAPVEQGGAGVEPAEWYVPQLWVLNFTSCATESSVSSFVELSPAVRTRQPCHYSTLLSWCTIGVGAYTNCCTLCNGAVDDRLKGGKAVLQRGVTQSVIGPGDVEVTVLTV